MSDVGAKFDATRRGVLGSLTGVGAILPLSSRRTQPAMARASQGAVRVHDFLDDQQLAAAATSSPLDCTAAFARALVAGPQVIVDPGHYALNALRLVNGCRLIGEAGAVIHQADATRPAVACVSDAASGQLADISLSGLTLVGHPNGRSALLLLEAKGGYAIWRSYFSLVMRNCFRALEVRATDANNVFSCEFEVVSEGTRDTAVLVQGGVYNRFHLFLSQTQSWALDDASSCSEMRVVAENSVIFRGQGNQVCAFVEGIAAPQAASDIAITDRGFGNVFMAAQVNMPTADAGKLRYAFKAFERSIFLSPQILGAGAPPHPFAPTSNFAFTVVGGRSAAAHKVEATFDGSDPDHDMRNVTFVGDVRDFTDLATQPGTTTLQHVSPQDGASVKVEATTHTVFIDPVHPLAALNLIFPATLMPIDGWTLGVVSTQAISRLAWPADARFAKLPSGLTPRVRIDLVYRRDGDRWLVT